MKPMLASGLNEEIVKAYLANSGPLFMSPKLDGIRCNVRDGVAYGGRSGKEIPNKHIQASVRLGDYDNLDGELIVGPPSGENVYKKTFSGVMAIEGTPLFTFWAFDDFTCPGAPYVERYKELRTFDSVRALPQVLVSSWEQVLDIESDLLSRGYEGAMLRRPPAPYKFGRATEKSLDLMKVKREEDSEGQIIACYEAMENQNEAVTNAVGHTERSTHQENLVGKGMLGGFWILYNGMETKCAPGKFDHKERLAIWQEWLADPEGMKKKFIKFRHFPYGADKKPRFPRALGFRDPIDMDS